MLLIEFLQTEQPFFVGILFVLGLVCGSFLNVVIYRLPIMLNNEWQAAAQGMLGLEVKERPIFNLVMPNSICPKCGHKIRAWENIPLISYLFLGGKCSSCKTSISIRYPIVEFSAGIIAAYIAWHFGFSYHTLWMLIFAWSLLVMSLIDIDHQILPDNIVLPMLWLGLIINQFSFFTTPTSALIGAIVGYLSLWLVYWGFKLLTGKEGMGYGDFKMLAMLGSWCGWQLLPFIILASSIVGAILGIVIIKMAGKNYQTTTLPFGPYLAVAGFIALVWGNYLITNYLPWLAM